jgi:hypothetical protein
MDFLDKQIPPPRSWDKFEDLVRALFACVWENPLAQKNGRRGQSQNGVDVFGEFPANSGSWVGVQCKGKDAGYGSKASPSEFDAELAKAEHFTPVLSRWIFATTAPGDGRLQEHARQVSTVRIAAGKFPADVLGWDSLLALIAQHPAVLGQFYPEHSRSVWDETDVLRQASVAALDAIDDSLRQGETSVTLLRPDVWKSAKDALDVHGLVRLTGEGGAGKSGVLKRLGSIFPGPLLVLKDNRVLAQSLQQHFAQLGVLGNPTALLDAIAEGRSALCLIDGADRLLMSERRGVVLDLFRAIATSPARAQWSIVTSARAYQERDLVADALTEAGFEQYGTAIEIGAITDEEAKTLGLAFPSFASLLARDDLARQNRSLFLVRELLQRGTPPTKVSTEIDIADAWAGADLGEPGKTARRSKTLSQIGEHLSVSPWRLPNRADLDPDGLQMLVAEGAILTVPNRDALRLVYDVHEDWLLARSLHGKRDNLPEVLREADQPLWWMSAARLMAQAMLEEGDLNGWQQLLSLIAADSALDPAWSRAILVAPLYSERAREILPQLEPILLEKDATLLLRLFDTLIVFETRISEKLIAQLAHLDEAQRYAAAAYWKVPHLRSWVPFLRWSLAKWRHWPARLIPRLSELAAVFARATSDFTNPLSREMAAIAKEWLLEIEDAGLYDRWENRREPFGTKLGDYEAWGRVEERLREVLVQTVKSAPKTVQSYLNRLTQQEAMREGREQLLGSPGGIPAALPAAWTDMCLVQSLGRRRRPRHGPDDPFRYDIFSWYDYQHAGIREIQGFFPSSPRRGGFADLFQANEAEALRLFHRLEMRASVFWRWYMKCHDRKAPRPVSLEMPWGKITLWGDEAVYRWSRGILGSNVLGSAYLALDDWMERQTSADRPIGELLSLVLQNNGLVATASPCIALLCDHINTAGAIDHAGPFLGTPKLWDYDIRRHVDDRGAAHRIGFSSAENIHFRAVERIHQRYSSHQPLSHSLLLPFRLLGSETSQRLFDQQRASWSVVDLVEFDGELDTSETRQAYEKRIARCMSDSDRSQLVFEKVENGIKVSIAAPKDVEPAIEAMLVAQQTLEEAARLLNWMRKTREQRQVAPELSIDEAISLANELTKTFEASNNSDFDLPRKLGGEGIVGTAAVVANYGSATVIGEHRGWIEHWLLSAAQLRRDDEAVIDSAILLNDMQVSAAWGLAALASRDLSSETIDSAVVTLAVQRLHAVSEAVLEGLIWTSRPAFARAVHIAALDSCVIEIGRWWLGDEQRRKAAHRTAQLRARAAKRALAASGNIAMPLLPPRPYSLQWIWTGKWPLPIKRLKLQAARVLDWGKAQAVLKRVDWTKLTDDGAHQTEFSRYLAELVAWTRAYSEDEDRRFDNRFPYEWAHTLARELGRFAAVHGSNNEWRPLLQFTHRERAEELVGDYLDGVVRELIESRRSPDNRFWSAWKPAAEWLLEHGVPKKRGHHDSLSHAACAAGLVGPYVTPIPPDWPHLEFVLSAVDQWVRATSHLPAGAYASLAIVERMNASQRERWFLSWLMLWTAEHGTDESFWSYNSLGDKVAALLKPLASSSEALRANARQALAIVADAGATVARELIPSFAPRRSG